MKRITQLLSFALITGTAALITTTCYADAAQKAPAAAEFYPLVGHWHGKGELSEAEQKPIKLIINLSCHKVSSGWGVACTMKAKNKQMAMSESDLMGVDPVTGQAHWYAVTDQGETHDHLAKWTAANSMEAHYDWVQDGKKMQENISFNLKRKTMQFQSVVSANGQKAGQFIGSLMKK